VAPRRLTRADLRRAKVGERFWGARLSSIPEGVLRTKLEAYFERWQEARKRGLGLLRYGPNSSGKTHAATVGVKHALAHGCSALIEEAAVLKHASIVEPELLARAKEVDFLVVDDLGRGVKGTAEYAKTLFGEVLRNRARRRRVTWLTTNMTLGEIREDFGEAVHQMLVEVVYPVKVHGVNWRESIRDENAELFS